MTADKPYTSIREIEALYRAKLDDLRAQLDELIKKEESIAAQLRAELAELKGGDKSDTPRMERASNESLVAVYEQGRQLERELAEALEWKHYLSSWGGTPEIVYSFIIGQQARIYAAQEVEKHLAAVTDQRDSAIAALEKIASLDFVITLPDRMDAVRDIANEALNKIQP